MRRAWRVWAMDRGTPTSIPARGGVRAALGARRRLRRLPVSRPRVQRRRRAAPRRASSLRISSRSRWPHSHDYGLTTSGACCGRRRCARRSPPRADEETLTRIEDAAIRELIARQEASACPLIVDGEFRRSGYLASFSEIEGAEHWLERWTPATVGRENPVEAGAVRGHDPLHSDDLRSAATSPAAVAP